MSYSTIERGSGQNLERKCRKCGEWLPINCFVKAKTCFRGRRPVCRACHYEKRDELRASIYQAARGAGLSHTEANQQKWSKA